ncbi:MAG: type II toxin-antitoxin system Phd/YefM family antitoxin [Candidatus Brocadiia bacterium]
MKRVDLPQLKEHIDEYIDEVEHGEEIVVAEQHREIARISPPNTPVEESIKDLIKSDDADWDGGKPAGVARPVSIEGKSVAQIVSEDRR